MKRFRVLLSGILLGLMSGLSIPGSADDIEIYLRDIPEIDGAWQKTSKF